MSYLRELRQAYVLVVDLFCGPKDFNGKGKHKQHSWRLIVMPVKMPFMFVAILLLEETEADLSLWCAAAFIRSEALLPPGVRLRRFGRDSRLRKLKRHRKVTP